MTYANQQSNLWIGAEPGLDIVRQQALSEAIRFATTTNDVGDLLQIAAAIEAYLRGPKQKAIKPMKKRK